MYSFTLYSAVVVVFVSGILEAGKHEHHDAAAVLVKINPFISKSRRVIQFSGDGRFKRDGPEKSALYLEFPESFFEDPKLKRLYRSLIGERDPGKSKVSAAEKTDIVFQIDPLAFGKEEAKHKKRDVRREDLAAFQLKIAPAASHVKQMGRGLQGFVPRHETTKAWCSETMPIAGLSPNPLMNEGAQEASTDIVAETMCYPSKPSTPKLRICGGTTTEDLRAERPNDPCQCYTEVAKEEQQVETTPYDLYTQCRSQDPIVTHFVESLCFTTERCSPKTTYVPYAVDVFSTTYRSIPKPSCPPSSKPTCAPPAPFRRFLRRRRKDNQLKNFFLLSNSPQSCPPFCPLKCTTSKPTDCSESTTCSVKTTCTCTTTAPTKTRSSTTCKTAPTCFTSTAKDRCPMKHESVDDPLRNVLRIFHKTNPSRVRRSPPPFRRRRHVWIYKPKRRLQKISFRSAENVRSLQ